MSRKSPVKCENPNCGKEFLKLNGEINRSKKLGRKQYCCMRCYAETEGKHNLKLADPEKVAQARRNIKNYCDNLRDEYTPFRFFTHVIRNSRKTKEFTVTEEDLAALWVSQGGICPHTGWELELPDSTNGWKNGLTMKSASLDRLDNSRGYVPGNLRFVAYMSNVARNRFGDEEMFEFCKAVTDNRKR